MEGLGGDLEASESEQQAKENRPLWGRGSTQMKTEIGEYVVGAYLKLCLGCDFVDYNVRPPTSGLEGLAELDVVGLRFGDTAAFVCEVSTHLGGLQYGGNQETIKRLKEKFARQKRYAKNHLKSFAEVHYMFWSPRVAKGILTREFEQMRGVEFVINEQYTARIEELREQARTSTRDVGNPFFRTLQLLEHLRV